MLNASDFQTELSGIIYKANTSGLSPGNAGANQVWDFSGLTLNQDNAPINTVAVATAFSASSFPASNYCYKATFNNANYVDTVYEFYSLSSVSFERMGNSSSGDNTINKRTDTEILFQFPYTYNTTINDTYQHDTDTNPISVTSVYDAYGTLITPFGTYTNVIRKKNTEGTFVSYNWFHTNPYFPIMGGDFTDNGSLQVLKNTTGLGVNPIESKKAMAIFPNPTHKELNIQLPAQQILDRVAITDVTGKIVLKQDQNLNQINVSHLANGLYFIEVHSGMEKLVTKFIKN